jgi:CHASE3 domain sensor protein
MQESNEIKEILSEMRDLQREALAQYRQTAQQSLELQREHIIEYQKASQQSIELQQQAVARQKQFAVLYRRVLLVAAIVIISMIVYLLYISSRTR